MELCGAVLSLMSALMLAAAPGPRLADSSRTAGRLLRRAGALPKLMFRVLPREESTRSCCSASWCSPGPTLCGEYTRSSGRDLRAGGCVFASRDVNALVSTG